MENLYGKICWNNQVHKFGLQFAEIILLNFFKMGRQNWVYNLVDHLFGKLAQQFGAKLGWKN